MSVGREADERLLLQQVIAGDTKSFSCLYNLYNRSIYTFILKYVHSVPLAEDLTQEVFLKIWENRFKLNHIQSFKAYLFVTARNHTLNSLKVIFKSEVAMGEVMTSFINARSETEETISDKEYLEFLQRALNKLPKRTREIFMLCREQGRTYEEVAKALNISRNAVKNHMVQSMKVLSISVEKELGISLIILLIVLFKM